jgi:hypothetical protein
MPRLLLILVIFLLCLNTTAQSNLPRRPSIDELASYLRANLQTPPQEFISYFWPDEENALHYRDVNGDGEEDLIAQGWLFVAVLLWERDGYSLPFQHIVTTSPESGAWSKVSFQDVTLDSRPEIVFDVRLPHRGQNSGGNRFERSLIHCDSDCRIIWQEEIANYFWVNSSEVGIYLYQSEIQALELEGAKWLELSRRDFAFNCRLSACRVGQEQVSSDLYRSASRVGALVKIRYLWDGLRFNRFESLILVDTYPIAPQSQLAADYENQHARIDIQETCLLLINEIPLGSNFLCLLDFSRLEWRDVTGDSIPELLLEYAYFDTETLVIYSIEGQEMGRITGVIREANLFGVRILENGILATGNRYSETCDFCWYELTQTTLLYQWNGSAFVLV